MSYTVDLIVGSLPASDAEAWRAIETLRERYHEDKSDKAPALVKLHEQLIKRYPCLCSYAEDDPAMEQSPWADGPMLGNFASEMGMLAIVFSRVDEVVPFIIEQASNLSISVADGQTGRIYRPIVGSQPPVRREKPWWKFW
jgi:hypothetical protein